jgi:hypothetical protein
MSNDITDLFAQLETTTIEDKPIEQPIRQRNKLLDTEKIRSQINLAVKNEQPLDVIADLSLQGIAIAVNDPMIYPQNKPYIEGIQVLKNEVSAHFKPYIELVKNVIKDGLTEKSKADLLVYNNIFYEYDKKLDKYGLKGWIVNELERLEKE